MTLPYGWLAGYRTVLLFSLVLGAKGGVIGNSITMNSEFPQVTGNIASQACVYPLNTAAPTCSYSSPASASSSSAAGSTNATGSGFESAGSVNLIQPAGSLGMTSSSGGYNQVSTAVNALSFAPDVSLSMLMAPGPSVTSVRNVSGSADQQIQQVSASGNTLEQSADLRFSVQFTDAGGTASPETFSYDPGALSMELAVGTGATGSIGLTQDFYTPGHFTNGPDLIDFTFANGIVTESKNTVGLALPGVGAAASFNSAAPGLFSIPITMYDPSQGPVTVFSSVDQSGSLDQFIPEPATWDLFGFGGLALLGIAKLNTRHA